MKKIIQCLIVFVIVFAVVFVVDSVMNQNKTKVENYSKSKNAENTQEEYKVSNNLYFENSGIELTLYKDKTYLLYNKNDIQAGTYKIVGEELLLEQTKSYNENCYDLVKANYSYKVSINSVNEITNITLFGIKLNKVDSNLLKNSKDILLNKNIACEIKTTKSDEVTNEVNTTTKNVKNTNNIKTNNASVKTNQEVKVEAGKNTNVKIENKNTIIINGKEIVNDSNNKNENTVVITYPENDKNKDNKISYPEKNNWKLVDETKGKMCTQSLVKIGTKDNKDYYVSNACVANSVYVVFGNNTKYSVKEAIEKGKVSLNDLINELNKKGFKTTVKEVNTKCAAPTYKVIFDTNGGNKISDKDYKYSGNKEDLPIPTKEGYKFLGWYSDKNLTNQVKMVNNKLEGANFTKECYKTTTIYAKWEKEITYNCPDNSKLVNDSKLGNICVKSYNSTNTKTYPYACKAVTKTWKCPNNGFDDSKIEDPSVGCHADALLSSQDACTKAGCTIKSSIYSEENYYTKETMDQFARTYNIACRKVNYVEIEYLCQSGWYKLPSDNTKCYVSATLN